MPLPYAHLEQQLRELPLPPTDDGSIALVVVRPDVEERQTPGRCALTPEGGVSGDRWARRPELDYQSQVTLMRADVARLFSDGQPLSLFGDNLLVELDLSLANLPPGTRLRIGEALCEVTPKPHTGCGKFAARFGEDARAITAAPEFKDLHLRGIHVRVLEPGEVSPGDAVSVIQRPVAG